MLNSSSAARAQGIQWTRPYLVELCDEMRQALEAWAGEPDDSAPDLDQARAVSRKLAGTLQALGVSGAAALVESLGRALNVIDEPDPETAMVLLESIAILPDYLERLETGAPDAPEVLAEFIERTHSAVGLDPLARPTAVTGIEALNDEESGEYVALDIENLRRTYQRALRDWLKNSGDIDGLIGFTHSIRQAHQMKLRRLGRVGEAVFKGLAGGQLRPGPKIQAHLASLDQLLRRLAEDEDDDAGLALSDAVTLSLLEDLQAAEPGCLEIDEIRAATDPKGVEAIDLERARSVLSGRNRELFTAIAEAARGELNHVKDTLNEFLLGHNIEGPAITEQAGLLRSVADSLGMIGLDRLKQRVRQQADRLGELTADPENPVMLDVARALLLVESELDECVLYLGEAPESDLLEGDGQHLPKAEHRRVMRQVLRESLDDLGQAKHLLDQAHRGQTMADGVEQAIRILGRVAGVLHMAGQPIAGEMLAASAAFIHDEMGRDGTSGADPERLDALAEALVVVEFYLDSMTRLDERGSEYLHDARNRLLELGYLSESEAAGEATAEGAPEATAEKIEAPKSPEPDSPFDEVMADEATAVDGDQPSPIEPDAASDEDRWSIDSDGASEETVGAETGLGTEESSLTDESDKPDRETEGPEEPHEDQETVDEDAKDEKPLSIDFGDFTEEGGGAEAGTGTEDSAGAEEDESAGRGAEDSESADEGPLSIDFEPSPGSPSTARDPGPELPEQAPVEPLVPEVADFESAADEPDAPEGLESDGHDGGHDMEAEAPAPTTGSALDGEDFDLRSIFLEEFDEELASLQQRYPDWRAQLTDQSILTEIRRSFHTLKGSGRMAGAERIGEFAWQIEQLLNQTLDGQYSAEQVADLVGDAIEALPSLRADLDGETAEQDADNINSLIGRVAGIGEESDLPELEGLDSTLIQLMIKEINDHLETIDRWIETSRQHGWPADVDRDLIRAVHTIKGTLRLAPIGDEAESLQLIEEYLQEVLDIDVDAGEASVELMEDLRSLLGKRLDRLQRQAVSTDHFNTEPLASQARALISDLHREAEHDETPQAPWYGEAAEKTQPGVDFAEFEGREASSPADLEENAPEEEALERGSAEEEAPEEETPEAEAPEEEAPEEEAPEEEAPEEEAPEEEAPEEEAPEEEAPEEEAPEEEAPEEEAPEEEAPEEEAPEEEAPEEEAPEEEAPEEEAPEEFERAEEAASSAPVAFEPWPETQAHESDEASADPAPEDTYEIEYSDLDAELLELFTDEGQELLEHSDGLLQQWRDNPEDRQLVTALQRDIHTVKGSARMAGLNPVGEVAHVLEDLLENIAGGRQQATAASIDTLEAGCDHLHAMLDAVEKRQPLPARTALEDMAAEEQALGEEVPAPTRADLESSGTERTGRSSSIRLGSEQVEELLNFAGEVSIFRSRIEQEIGAFRGNVGEVEQTVARLREQLRKLEQETEAQILSRYEREHGSSDSTFDPLELDRYSTIQQLSRALAESVSDLNSLTELMDDSGRQSETLLMQQARVNTELQEGLMQARLVSFNTLAPRLRRVVRNSVRDTGRKANLEIILEGEGELDRNVLDRVTAPIEHILRNAVAHGIEPPSARESAGKPETGRISITIDREATELLIRVSDDGAGLDMARIRERALEMDLLTEEQAEDAGQLTQIIFHTGFSTAYELSELAGRGVGMDVVSSEVRQIGGRISVDSVPGQGTRFTLRIPLSLAVMQAIFVTAGDRMFAIPLQAVRGVARIRPAEWREALDDDGTYRYGGDEYPLIELDPQLGFEPVDVGEESLSLLMISTGDQRAAIRVEDIQGHREVVLKPVGPQISSIPGVLGGTIMGDGQVVVLLDMAPLIERALAEHRLPGIARADTLEPAEEEVKRTPLVMVIDDSITMRRVTARILEHYGLEVITARDGVEAVDMLFERVPDLMLLDIEMPRMDGFELATYVREESRLSHVPIMMITSRSGDKHRQHAKELGVNRYLIKPYQEANMVRNVFEMLEMPVPGGEE